MELRIRFLSILFVFSVIIIAGRLFFWQVVEGQELAQEGKFQQQHSKQILAKRGDILAKDGSWLAASADAWLLYASRPQFDQDPQEIAEKLSELFISEMTFEIDENIKEDENIDLDDLQEEALEKEEERLFSLLSNEKLMWIPLKNKVDSELRGKIDALNIPGLYYQEQEARIYPEASAASHVLGFVGKDDDGNDKGYFGLEGYYDMSLAGKSGFQSRESNAFGAPIIFGENKQSAAVSGANLITHIDKTIQLIVENNLNHGIEKYGASSGNIIVLRPSDGAVLAMATSPGYEPDNYSNYSNELFRNPVISDSFEPGSIFKPIVMAAGIDAGVVNANTICDICNGPYKIDKYFIRTWNDQYRANSTMTDAIIHSDNVGMVFVGKRLGADKLYDYLEKFGFGSLTGVDLQGEMTPSIRSRGTWSNVDLATTTFGQGIAVTPIQMVKALSAIANGGKAAEPQIVDKIQIGNDTHDIKPQVSEAIISPQAASEVTNMMVLAVKDGEAKWAVPEGFKVAGKTGTAQIPVAGHYDAEKTIASFVGFAPPDDPEFLMLITLREPKSSPWASETAAPLWFDIAKELFPYLGLQPGKM